MSPEELRACRERAEACFRAPWIATDPWTVEPDGDGDCEEVRSVLSPDEYPGGQVVAECHDDGIIVTPGLREFAEAHSAFIAEARTDVPRLLATIAARDEEIRRIAEALGRMHEADGHAPFPASVDELVRRAEELTRAENDRGDARAALSEHRHAALLAAGIHGGPGAWRWASDPTGTTLDDEAAWERLLGEMRERSAPPRRRARRRR